MNLTVTKIIEQIRLLKVSHVYSFIRETNHYKFKLVSIDSENGPIRFERLSPEGESQSVTVSTMNITKLADKISDNTPFSIDSIVGASGNWRSLFESALAYTPEFYFCKINGRKRLIWCPDEPHALNELVEKDCTTILANKKENSSDEIIEEFKYFIENCTKSANSFRNYYSGFSTLNEYIRKIYPQFTSLLDYTDINYLQYIYNKLLADPDFAERDSGNQSKKMYSNAFASYLMFLRAREYFSNHTLRRTSSLPMQTMPVKMFRRYATAIQSKPFVLLAGISGTGKSRIVRQLAFATGGESPDRVQKPFNYEMIQVRPNWHDSTELMGYETRISGDPEYKTTDFLRFLAKAWYFEGTPFFLCLDEMNLAPVEQYFAEYLSVLETRKLRGGKIETDPLVPALNSFGKKRDNTWVGDSILNDLFGDVWRRNGEIVDKDKGREALLRETFRTEGIGLPPNLIVMGTVNMDETTFSFSRKVLDRAMTLEMNEADLGSGLSKAQTSLPAIDAPAILPYAVEAVDVYESNRETCDIVIAYLNRINETLKGTPFKIAYRTRNEAILYVLSNLTYPDNDACYNLIRALDEVTDMKILSRIEGDKNKLMNWQQTGCILDDLKAQIQQQFDDIYKNFDATEGEKSMYGNMQEDSISLRKLEEMKRKLENTYYCTYWS